MNQDSYLSERLEDQIKWYDAKSQKNQRWFRSLSITGIVCATVIPFVAGMSDSIPHGQFVIGGLGVIIAISTGLLALNKYQENWLTYRTTCETLRHEKYLFSTHSKPYDGDDAFNQLVERVEGLISKENSQWSSSQGSSQKTNKP